MKPVSYANIEVQPESITPLYDNLLVRRIDDEQAGAIILSGMTQTKDGRWVRKTDAGPRRGVVVAAGRGDKGKVPELYGSTCGSCGIKRKWIAMTDTCWCACGEVPHEQIWEQWEQRHSRVPMAVSVGDTIIYPRFESSHVMIDGQQFTFVHEADVMAVIDA